MPFLSYRRALQLQNELKGTKASVVLPEDERYAMFIRRWSDTSEREAVSHNLVAHIDWGPKDHFTFLCLFSANHALTNY